MNLKEITEEWIDFIDSKRKTIIKISLSILGFIVLTIVFLVSSNELSVSKESSILVKNIEARKYSIALNNYEDWEKEFSKFPIYEGNEFMGLVTSRAVTKWLQKHIENNNIELDGTMKDILDYEKKSQYEFVKESMTVYDAWQLFQKSPKKLDALLLTSTGDKSGEIEAVITYDDLLKYIYTNDQYVFN